LAFANLDLDVDGFSVSAAVSFCCSSLDASAIDAIAAEADDATTEFVASTEFSLDLEVCPVLPMLVDLLTVTSFSLWTSVADSFKRVKSKVKSIIDSKKP
jgi:hypothetical protein